MFVDEVTIEVESGKGGKGCISFRREKYVPRGGPDGGDGGKGGSIFLESTYHYRTLNHIKNLQRFKAGNGKPGEGKEKHGADGKDRIIQIPPGTYVTDVDTSALIYDFDSKIKKVEIVKGGEGGLGNVHFKSSTNQAPRRATDGKEGENRQIRLELKLLADVGLIGLPNAGKSSLLRKISAATPKIAAYPFTTLAPQLGVVEIDDIHSFTVADIPGLIEGAHTGSGLGDRFLRHIERTKFLIHVIDISEQNQLAPDESYITIKNELTEYNPEIAEKSEVVVFNKIDIVKDAARDNINLNLFIKRGVKAFFISAKTGEGIDKLINYVGNELVRKKIGLYGDVLGVPK
jgi:GTP-binding protein